MEFNLEIDPKKLFDQALNPVHPPPLSIHVPGLLLKWLNLITAPGSVSNEPGSVSWLATKYLITVNCQLEKSNWKINNIVTTEYIIWSKINIPSSYFTISMLNCLENTFKLQFDINVTAVKFLIESIFKTTWLDLNSNTAGISLDSSLKYSKITYRYAKTSTFTWLL